MDTPPPSVLVMAWFNMMHYGPVSMMREIGKQRILDTFSSIESAALYLDSCQHKTDDSMSCDVAV